MKLHLGRIVLATIVLATAAGCASSTSVRDATTAISSQIPGCHLEKEEHIKLGPVSMALVRALAGLAGEDLDEETRAILSDIRRVEVATYNLRPPMDPDSRLSLGNLEDSLLGRGWSPMVREHDKTDLTWVFVREDSEGEIKGLFVVSVDSHEVEVVRVEGSLDRIIAEAIAEDKGALDFLIDS